MICECCGLRVTDYSVHAWPAPGICICPCEDCDQDSPCRNTGPEELMHNDDLDERELEFEREQDAIAADIARTNQERDYCAKCGMSHDAGDWEEDELVPEDPFAGVRAGHALLDDVKAQYEGWQKDEPVSKKARRIVERYFEDKPYDGELRGQLFDLIMEAFR